MNIRPQDLFKKIGVRAGAGEYDGAVIPQLVNQQEVTTDMTLAETFAP